MTAFLVLIAFVIAVDLVVGVRTLRRNRPAAPPASHHDWTSADGRFPSAPYALGG